jgi:hypothetical protein
MCLRVGSFSAEVNGLALSTDSRISCIRTYGVCMGCHVRCSCACAQMEEEVYEADSLIKFMSRCCLFQVLCCCCADSKEDMRRDRTRKARLRQRRGEDEVVRRAISMATQDKKASYGFFDGGGDDAELERVAAKYRPQSQKQDAKAREMRGAPYPSIISEEQMETIANETEKQDVLLERIGDTVDRLKVVSEALQTELDEQDPQIERMEGRVVETKYSLTELTSKARRIR